mgnify:FL=1
MNPTIRRVTLAFLVVVLCVLIVHIAILLTLLLYQADTPHVVMMGHHRRKQHAQRRHPKAEDIKSSFMHEIEKYESL